jgi:hypothetical protein
MQLLVICENEAESNEIKDLVARWRWAMRLGSGTTGSGLMSLGLLRLDGMMLENGGNGQQNQGQAQVHHGMGMNGAGS